MKISSQIDVITNSSSECYIFNIDSPEYQEIKSKVNVNEIKTYDDIWNLLFEEDYGEDELEKILNAEHGTWSEEKIPTILNPIKCIDRYEFEDEEEYIKEKKEMWKRHKEKYSFFLNKAVILFDDDCCGEEYIELLDKASSKIRLKHLIEKIKRDCENNKIYEADTPSGKILVTFKDISDNNIDYSLCIISEVGQYLFDNKTFYVSLFSIEKFKLHEKILDPLKTTVIKITTENNTVLEAIPYYLFNYHKKLDLIEGKEFKNVIEETVKQLLKTEKVINIKTFSIYDNLIRN